MENVFHSKLAEGGADLRKRGIDILRINLTTRALKKMKKLTDRNV